MTSILRTKHLTNEVFATAPTLLIFMDDNILL